MTTDVTIRKCSKISRNWTGNLDPSTKFDFETYNQGPAFKNDKITDVDLKQIYTLGNMEVRSPRLLKLAETIFELDTKDFKKHGHTFKHFIFSDSPNEYGAKLIASALQTLLKLKPIMEIENDSERGTPVVKVGKGGRGHYGLLTPTRILKTEYKQTFKTDMLKKYNSPQNVFGQYMRFIILDKAYKEGIDLKNVRYAHLFEPLPTYAQEKQAVARAIRFCSHKDMYYVPDRGWKVDVHVYKLYTPEKMVVDIYDPLTKQYQKRTDVDMDALIQQIGLSAESNYNSKFVDFAEVLGPAMSVDFYLTRKLIPKPNTLQPWLQGQVNAVYEDMETQGDSFAARVFRTYPKSVIPDPEKKNNCLFLETYLTNYQKFLGKFVASDRSRLGMLLWHSPGSGKTCTAMHIAEKLCEQGYQRDNVCWATTWALGNERGDVECKLKDSRVHIPHPVHKKEREAQDIWLGLVYSYKRLKTHLKDVTETRGADLDGVVIIIDEAHLLYSGELQTNEILSPDELKIIRKALAKAWLSTDKESKTPLRVILLTGTPVANPKYLFKLLNLIRDPRQEPLPENMEGIQQRYGADPDRFDARKLLDDTDGYVSYLDTKMDSSRFAKRTDLVEHRVYMSVRDNAIDENQLKDITKRVDIAEVKLMQTLRKYLRDTQKTTHTADTTEFLAALRENSAKYFQQKDLQTELTKKKTTRKMSIDLSQETAFRKCKLLNEPEDDVELKKLRNKSSSSSVSKTAKRPTIKRLITPIVSTSLADSKKKLIERPPNYIGSTKKNKKNKKK